MPSFPSPLLRRRREEPSGNTNKTVIYIVIVFPIVGALVLVAICWACVWLRRRERREATLRRGAAVQELRDANIHRERESMDDEEEVARALAEGEVAPAYHEPGVTVVVGAGAEAPRYEQVVQEARRELPEVVPPAYVK